MQVQDLTLLIHNLKKPSQIYMDLTLRLKEILNNYHIKLHRDQANIKAKQKMIKTRLIFLNHKLIDFMFQEISQQILNQILIKNMKIRKINYLNKNQFKPNKHLPPLYLNRYLKINNLLKFYKINKNSQNLQIVLKIIKDIK